MKKLLTIILIISACNASAQTYVKDTTEVGNTLLVVPKTGTMKYDKLDVSPSITGQVTALQISFNNLSTRLGTVDSIVKPVPNQISGMQSIITFLTTQGTGNSSSITSLNNRVTTLEQGIPITVIDTPKRINVTGTSYTIGEGDNGANIFCYSTCTIYAGHGTGGYKVNVYRLSGAVTILPMSGISLLSVAGYRRIQQYGKAELMFEGPARVLLTGQLAK